mmetsp:Transcript_61629/g.133428  ORF Transcript_61629/g.133428 Transcript_61629/m.133428 type:complete len:317 (+) Transcript_61629:46-996(+)
MASSPAGNSTQASFASGADSRIGSSWQDDSDALQCVRCSTAFNTIIRRHHCRQCRLVVCGNCSKTRRSLPEMPDAGKLRICDACEASFRERQAQCFEEDDAEKANIIAQLRKGLSEKTADFEAFKKILIELVDGEAPRFLSPLEQSAGNPANDAFPFDVLKDQLEKGWNELSGSLERHAEQRELEALQQEAIQRKDRADKDKRELNQLKRSLEKQLGEVRELERKRDELLQLENHLNAEVKNAGRRVQELESERIRQRRQPAHRSSLTDNRRLSNQLNDPVVYTVTPGYEDTYSSHRDRAPLQQRLEGCRRSCVIA